MKDLVNGGGTVSERREFTAMVLLNVKSDLQE